MVATGTTTASNILHHISTFISEILAQSDLRKRLLSAVCSKISISDQISLKPLGLAAEALENAISADNFSIRSSSLRCAEELLLSLPENPFVSFLSSLVYGLNHQHYNSALSLLDLFRSDPSLARSEIAPILYEELFLRHFLPIFHRYNEQRSKILTSFPSNVNYNRTEYSTCDESGVFPCTKSLSKLSIDQTRKLKDLEINYEQVLDKNCRVFAKHFKKILEGKDEGGSIATPKVKLLNNEEKWEEMEQKTGEKLRTEQLRLPNGRQFGLKKKAYRLKLTGPATADQRRRRVFIPKDSRLLISSRSKNLAAGPERFLSSIRLSRTILLPVKFSLRDLRPRRRLNSRKMTAKRHCLTLERPIPRNLNTPLP